ncbi:hypothetical protein L596_012061 [Steinernema carpocapsae]|uniref:Uncharacterized protein n=1 Tax=Steinernema carpocapsae TaxID=34508 RepID=A0A4U5NWS4_STECR|nr:hypothetical protein L596_012061 [Steinernema carpocapsae]
MTASTKKKPGRVQQPDDQVGESAHRARKSRQDDRDRFYEAIEVIVEQDQALTRLNQEIRDLKLQLEEPINCEEALNDLLTLTQYDVEKMADRLHIPETAEHDDHEKMVNDLAEAMAERQLMMEELAQLRKENAELKAERKHDQTLITHLRTHSNKVIRAFIEEESEQLFAKDHSRPLNTVSATPDYLSNLLDAETGARPDEANRKAPEDDDTRSVLVEHGGLHQLVDNNGKKEETLDRYEKAPRARKRPCISKYNKHAVKQTDVNSAKKAKIDCKDIHCPVRNAEKHSHPLDLLACQLENCPINEIFASLSIDAFKKHGLLPSETLSSRPPSGL